MNLFEDAYSGRILSVSAETDAELAELFPELNRRDEYRDADAWLVVNPLKRPRQKGTKRFLVNWLRKSAKQLIRERRKEGIVQRELRVGS